MSQGSSRIETLDCLRGIAAISVCIYHFTNGAGLFLPTGLVKSTGSMGVYGVPIFFVISGFVLPLAMFRAGYTHSSFGRFLIKRLVRLEPPYFAAILVTLACGFLAAQATSGGSGWPQLSWKQLLLHLGYLNAFAGYDWINPVFWTLAIEFQFYLLIGLLFPMLLAPQKRIGFAILLTLGGMAFVFPKSDFIFHHWFLFLLGMAAFFFRERLLSRRLLVALLLVSLVGGWLAMNLTTILVGAATSSAILWWKTRNPVLLFFGKISYSLYLLHGPIGMKIVNLSMHWPLGFTAKIAVIVVAFGCSTSAGYALWRWVERPAQAWSSRLRYHPKMETASL